MAEKGATEDQESVTLNVKSTKEKIEIKIAPSKTVKNVRHMVYWETS